MTTKGTRRLSGVNVNDFKNLLYHLHAAAEYSQSPNTASGQLYSCLQSAITEAKKPENGGYGSSATGDIMSVATLDEKRKTLIVAEFYVSHAEYRDEEAFKE